MALYKYTKISHFGCGVALVMPCSVCAVTDIAQPS